MTSSTIQAIVFDFGGVLINWDPHTLFNKYFSYDRQAIEAFLNEINFYSWNLAQDEGYPFSSAVKELSTVPSMRTMKNGRNASLESSRELSKSCID